MRDVTDAATMAAQPDRFRVDVLNVQHRAEPHTAGVLNDFAAIRAMGAARDLGLALGRDLAPAGFNDTPLASQLPVPLTRVHSPTAELRRRAVNLLVHRIAGEDIRSEVLMPRLMARECTGGAVGRLCRDRQTRASPWHGARGEVHVRSEVSLTGQDPGRLAGQPVGDR
ncbi:substrate-binding domain-containing protein [Streptomyces herbicida]|uniref:substrate-binding domain-containing protein n=1 Tax=Streptomyces herbicida TaxID=3065675 RepID=UPI0038CD1A39